VKLLTFTQRAPAVSVLVCLALGLLCGVIFPGLEELYRWVAAAFVRLLTLVVAPLIFSLVVLGVADSPARLPLTRQSALRLILCLALFPLLALVIGVAVTFIAVRYSPEMPGSGEIALAALAASNANQLEQWIPANAVAALSGNNLILVLIVAVLFAVGVKRVQPGVAQSFVELVRAVSAVCFQITQLLVTLAPLGAFAAAAALSASGNLNQILGVMIFAGAVLLGLCILVIVAFTGTLLMAGIAPLALYRDLRRAVTIGFANASGLAALPELLLALDNRGVPKTISGLVVPLSVSLNLSGSALFVGAACALAIHWAPVTLTTLQWLQLIVVAYFATLPAEMTATTLAALLAADALLDMARTAVNILGHGVVASVVATTAEPR
jgi:Na+/H+-dicarboxylate symporter